MVPVFLRCLRHIKQTKVEKFSETFLFMVNQKNLLTGKTYKNV